MLSTPDRRGQLLTVRAIDGITSFIEPRLGLPAWEALSHKVTLLAPLQGADVLAGVNSQRAEVQEE
jgi:hypothetical protein